MDKRVRFMDACKNFGDLEAVRHADLEMMEGEVVLVIGPSGSVVFMDEGEIIETGPPGNVFDNPAEDRTRRFLEHIL